MTTIDRNLPNWLELILQDPGATFADPEAVLSSTELTREEKLRVLRAWEYDAAEVSVAEEEGMPGGDEDLLQRILNALAALTDGDDVERVAPSKQHGLFDS